MSNVAICFSPSESEDSFTITNAGLVDNTALISMGGGDAHDGISAVGSG